jgi:F-type H+-transporting ATPase subunit alpha
VPDFGAKLVERLHSAVPQVLEKIDGGDWSDETRKALDDAVSEFASDYGYDLDEEGHPLEEGDTGEASRDEGDGEERDRDESDGGEQTEETEEQGEAVGAGS